MDFRSREIFTGELISCKQIFIVAFIIINWIWLPGSTYPYSIQGCAVCIYIYIYIYIKEDIGIEQQLYEIVRGKNFALNCLSCKFTEMIMITNKVIPENLLVVHWLWGIHPYKPTIEYRSVLLDGRFIGRFIEANFSKSTHNNQIFRNEFVCGQNHVSKISAQIIECKILTSLMLVYM